MAMLKRIQTFIESAKGRYLRKRWTAQGQLTVRRIFLIPTPTGWSYLAATLVILAFSINFSAIPGYLLAFLVASMLIVAMPLGLRNIVKLRLSIARVEPAFFREKTNVLFMLQNTSKRDRYSVQLEYEKSDDSACIDIARNSTATVALPFTALRRGVVNVPSLRISTTFPLGLIRVSAFWMPDGNADVYCVPEINGPSFYDAVSAAGVDDATSFLNTSENFSGVKIYSPGDKPRDMAWRQIAKFGGFDRGVFYTKIFDAEQGASRLFSEHLLGTDLSLDAKLSRITAWVLDAEKEGVRYGIDSLGVMINLGSGPEHCALCLRMLAQCEGGGLQ
jgi:uncharacterized protein (DUF58 family)